MQRRKSTGAVDAIEAALSSGTHASCTQHDVLHYQFPFCSRKQLAQPAGAPGSSQRTKTSHGTALSSESSITFNIDEGNVQSQLEVRDSAVMSLRSFPHHQQADVTSYRAHLHTHWCNRLLVTQQPVMPCEVKAHPYCLHAM